jgi:hypothetical protein
VRTFDYSHGRDFIEVFNGLASSSASTPFAGPKKSGMAVLVSVDRRATERSLSSFTTFRGCFRRW